MRLLIVEDEQGMAEGLRALLEKLRQGGIETPVMMLTARSSVADRIQGLDHGADDYLTKPFDTGEFLARVRALTRRNGMPLEDDPSFGDIRLDRRKLELCRGSERLRLGPK